MAGAWWWLQAAALAASQRRDEREGEQLPAAARVPAPETLLLPELLRRDPRGAPGAGEAHLPPVDVLLCHARGQPGGLLGLVDRWRLWSELRPGLPVAPALHALRLRVLVPTRLQGLPGRQLLQLHGLFLHLRGPVRPGRHPGHRLPRVGRLRLAGGSRLLPDQRGGRRGHAPPRHHVLPVGRHDGHRDHEGAQDLPRCRWKLPEGSDGVEHGHLAEPALPGGPVQQLLGEQPA